MPDPSDQLRRVDEALEAFSPELTRQYAGVRLMQAGLERHRAQLLTIASPEQLELTLTRPEQRGSGGELRLVAGVLSALQDSLAAIAQSLAGKPTARGMIPGAIKDSVELCVAAAVPGSLGLTLTPAFPDAQEPLFDDDDDPLLELSVERLLSVVAVPVDQRESLLAHIADLGPRATAHLQALSRTLAESGAGAQFRWRSPRHERDARLDHRRASLLQRTLTEVNEVTRTAIYAGRLVGAGLVRQTFELELDDGTLISGKVDEDVLPALETLFGQSCTGTVEVRQLTLPGGETRETHRLTALSP